MRDKRLMTVKQIDTYTRYLHEQEKSRATISQYVHHLQELFIWLAGREVSKALMIEWKENLTKFYAATSINVILAAANGFFDFVGWADLKIKPLKIQRDLFGREEQELTKEEYLRLVKTAEQMGNHRLALMMQTICATGIRVSELQYITVEAAARGFAEVSNKGKRRKVFLPDKLRSILKKYIRETKKETGVIFVTHSGRPVDRSNIWREMKTLCQQAHVIAKKVFPHNLRHLFARCFYSLDKDIVRLADILGHSSINTTRIYIAAFGYEHRRRIDALGLVI